MFSLCKSKTANDPRGAAILVASLTDSFAAEMEADADVYRRHYRAVEARVFPGAAALMEAVRGIDLLHFFGSIEAQGQLNTALGEPFTATTLLDACVSSDVKVVIIASENDGRRLCARRPGQTP